MGRFFGVMATDVSHDEHNPEYCHTIPFSLTVGFGGISGSVGGRKESLALLTQSLLVAALKC